MIAFGIDPDIISPGGRLLVYPRAFESVLILSSQIPPWFWFSDQFISKDEKLGANFIGLYRT